MFYTFAPRAPYLVDAGYSLRVSSYFFSGNKDANIQRVNQLFLKTCGQKHEERSASRDIHGYELLVNQTDRMIFCRLFGTAVPSIDQRERLALDVRELFLLLPTLSVDFASDRVIFCFVVGHDGELYAVDCFLGATGWDIVLTAPHHRMQWRPGWIFLTPLSPEEMKLPVSRIKQ